jgi:hypothetical protein
LYRVSVDRNLDRMDDNAERCLSVAPAGKPADHISRDGQRETPDDHRIQSDHVAGRIGKWTSRIPRSQAQIALNPLRWAQATDRSDPVYDSCCHRTEKAKRIPYCKDQFTDSYTIRIAERRRLEF